ncbi:TPA: Asp-tRNA(Asn)/Glu-tRNA(Gln) amidotransferase subunit GatC [Neisseria subflava]|jgi:aspartyl/glutamyl-tRNA(asn/gln) amidotransferase, C subunit|uniref:Aspartyl/glutamyl-tRNA(Asn/Gln) amidotransferase subunit C n=2 Tax=Neisseria TaxID=482 RepID=A0A9X7F9I5_NEIPE|nr:MULTISPECIES: Asp-tRNA(Asn)/Glu-tRNA(Gln) amidotransferase subunit GatC [Neisseria]MDK7241464.1 Asp-tRNA(Asn)/Glu-tRNA(Gln) amidotransferase subunit GatC [Neisseria subflava]OFK83178.1 asparaginyl/glutamyl-tRNA amidotransferase subunit C [Neisseria sp. HMSC061E12]OFP78827.1 asparaginyl/glutamyl-tRNA amidotransferase subunit C [Neisseria sp. HMSC066B07]OHO86210.1 asparaginyl/glutamyl-tRNA amidotransferase subunit C [Neisseria sp. HMSC056A04]OHQ23180.1 asparaginyl/glutamyl-tRNA amidotransfera
MALSLNDVEKIAKLSRLTLTDEEKNKTLAELNDIFAMVENMQSVNTDCIEPMAHPHEAALRLREDKVTETDHAAEYQAVAPEVRNRLYIVPQVIEE